MITKHKTRWDTTLALRAQTTLGVQSQRTTPYGYCCTPTQYFVIQDLRLCTAKWVFATFSLRGCKWKSQIKYVCSTLQGWVDGSHLAHDRSCIKVTPRKGCSTQWANGVCRRVSGTRGSARSYYYHQKTIPVYILGDSKYRQVQTSVKNG